MANPRAIAWVKNLSSLDLACRTLRHAWSHDGYRKKDPEDNTSTVGYDQVIVRHVHCLRCGTQKTDYYGRGSRQFDTEFARIKSRYTYPDGYRFRGDEHDRDRPISSDYLWEDYRRGADQVGVS
jgi:hypothetical protein